MFTTRKILGMWPEMSQVKGSRNQWKRFVSFATLPGENQPEFLLPLPARGKDNLIEWIAVRSDGEYLGRQSVIFRDILILIDVGFPYRLIEQQGLAGFARRQQGYSSNERRFPLSRVQTYRRKRECPQKSGNGLQNINNCISRVRAFGRPAVCVRLFAAESRSLSRGPASKGNSFSHLVPLARAKLARNPQINRGGRSPARFANDGSVRLK